VQRLDDGLRLGAGVDSRFRGNDGALAFHSSKEFPHQVVPAKAGTHLKGAPPRAQGRRPIVAFSMVKRRNMSFPRKRESRMSFPRKRESTSMWSELDPRLRGGDNPRSTASSADLLSKVCGFLPGSTGRAADLKSRSALVPTNSVRVSAFTGRDSPHQPPRAPTFPTFPVQGALG
jgi:hypothetical protein